MPRQAEHTNGAPEPLLVLTFGQMVDVLMEIYGVRDAERVKFVARINKVQRSGVPIGSNQGKGARVRYDLDQFLQTLVVLELAELSISLTNAAALVRREWPHYTPSLAVAHAWLQRKENYSVLLLATASEIGGFAEHATFEEARNTEAGRFMVAAPNRPTDGLRMVTTQQLLDQGRLNLGGHFLGGGWRTSLIDMSTLVPLVFDNLKKRGLASDESLSAWSREQCEDYEASE